MLKKIMAREDAVAKCSIGKKAGKVLDYCIFHFPHHFIILAKIRT